MKIVNIVGKKNSGKTTMIERLIPLLQERGLRVATVKHSPHEHGLDIEGKDSWRHRRAGAEAVMRILPNGIAYFRNSKDADEKKKLIQTLLGEFDLVLVEGNKHGPEPKVEVYRSAILDGPLCENPGDNLIAIMSDVPVEIADAENFHIDDIPALADLLTEFAKAM
jgi:molybdopterin-guanine dinucleotide biosynthesis adapter protein